MTADDTVKSQSLLRGLIYGGRWIADGANLASQWRRTAHFWKGRIKIDHIVKEPHLWWQSLTAIPPWFKPESRGRYDRFYEFKMHRWRESIVKTVDLDLRIYCYFLYSPCRAQYTGFIALTLHGQCFMVTHAGYKQRFSIWHTYTYFSYFKSRRNSIIR